MIAVGEREEGDKKEGGGVVGMGDTLTLFVLRLPRLMVPMHIHGGCTMGPLTFLLCHSLIAPLVFEVI